MRARSSSIIPIAGIAAVLYALWLAGDVLARDQGPEAMQAVAGTIFEGAVAFIRRQYTTIAILAVVACVILGAIIAIVETEDIAETSKLRAVPSASSSGS